MRGTPSATFIQSRLKFWPNFHFSLRIEGRHERRHHARDRIIPKWEDRNPEARAPPARPQNEAYKEPTMKRPSPPVIKTNGLESDGGGSSTRGIERRSPRGTMDGRYASPSNGSLDRSNVTVCIMNRVYVIVEGMFCNMLSI